MLIDRTTIFVRSGKGGDGCVSFRREKFIPKGGPDGGDGGTGGDVVLLGDASLSTLLPLTPRPHYRAGNGQPGRGRSMHGADGDDRIVPVPPGTLVYEEPGHELLVDIAEHGQRVVVARGGRGGFGNEHFKSATNQTPREATPGEPWEERTLRLELKLIADVGLIGMPNAGKSTLLSVVTRARPKIADYPFTTLSPHLGIATLPGERRFVIADIPGLIEGAARGAGLGHDFLRHVERTRLLVHLLDAVPPDGSRPEDNYHAIRAELAGHDPALADKPELVVLSKLDLVPDAEREPLVLRVRAALGLAAPEPLPISAATRSGIEGLLERCWARLEKPEPGWDGGGVENLESVLDRRPASGILAAIREAEEWSMTLVFPTARRASDQVFVQAIDDELVLYDLQRDKSHALNETAAFVFEHCDGKTSPAQLSALLAERHDLDAADATELMWLSLDRLEQANLLTAPVERPGAMTRRQVLKRAGIAAAVLPVVYSITAPAAAAMASDVPCGDPCTPALSRCQPPCECTLVGGGDGMSPFGGGGGTNICCERTTGGNCPGGDGMSPSGGGCTGVEADPQCCSGWRNMTTGQCCDCAGDG